VRRSSLNEFDGVSLVKKILFTLLLALAPISAWSDTSPTFLSYSCGAATGQIFSVGTLPAPLTVTSGVTGTSKTFGTAAANCGTAQIRSNSGTAMTDTLAAPGTVGANWYIWIANGDSSATDTVTPASGTISGQASLAISAGQNALIASDGTNFYKVDGTAGSSAGSGVTSFNGRTGAVAPTSGDYTVSQVTGAAPAASPALTGTPTLNGTALGTAATANTGTSGANVPLLNVANTWGAAQALGSSTATTQTAGDNSTKVATTAYVATAVSGVSAPALRDYIAGLTLSNDGSSPNTVIDISAGQATDSTNSKSMTLAAFTKTTGAFASGTGNGGLDTGTVAASTWYHVFLISNAGATTFDALLSKSATAPTMPGSFTLFRRVGSILTDSSSHILAFAQDGQTFYWTTPLLDANGSSVPTASRTLYTLTVPPGVKVRPQGYLSAMNGTKVSYLVTSPDQADIAPPSPIAQGTPGADMTEFNTQTVFSTAIISSKYTNTSAQIGIRANPGSSPSVASFVTSGWIDDRGIYN
jgi:hypothetical protein